MALQGSSLDRRPQQETEDPRVVRLMQQYGIYHPGLVYPTGSKRAAYEAEVLGQIHRLVQGERALTENVSARRDISQQNREQARDIHTENLQATIADREARNAMLQQGADTRRSEELQLIASDPGFSDEQRAAARAEIVRRLNLGTAAPAAGAIAPVAGAVPSSAAGGPKGEYGPGAAPAPAPKAETTTAYTPPTEAFTQPSIPARPTPSNRYYQESRYPASEGFTPQDRTRIARNLDRVQRQDEQINELLYKSDIGGANYARIYGTETARPGQPPAADIPQIYGGKPTIPDVSPVGYYDKAGKFLGPMYDEGGAKLPRPKGATGIHGTAAVPGVVIDPNTGRSIATTPEARAAMAGRFPVASSQPQGVAGPYGEANKAPNETMVAQPVSGYTPPTAAFVAPPATAPEKGAGGGVPAVAGGADLYAPTGTQGRGEFRADYGLAPNVGPRLLDFPAAPPTYLTPEARAAAASAAQPAAPPLLNPQAANEDLLKETEDTFYGGGHAVPPVPTPTPTPGTQHLVEAERQRRLIEQQRLAAELARRTQGSQYAFA